MNWFFLSSTGLFQPNVQIIAYILIRPAESHILKVFVQVYREEVTVIMAMIIKPLFCDSTNDKALIMCLGYTIEPFNYRVRYGHAQNLTPEIVKRKIIKSRGIS